MSLLLCDFMEQNKRTYAFLYFIYAEYTALVDARQPHCAVNVRQFYCPFRQKAELLCCQQHAVLCNYQGQADKLFCQHLAALLCCQRPAVDIRQRYSATNSTHCFLVSTTGRAVVLASYVHILSCS